METDISLNGIRRSGDWDIRKTVSGEQAIGIGFRFQSLPSVSVSASVISIGIRLSGIKESGNKVSGETGTNEVVPH